MSMKQKANLVLAVHLLGLKPEHYLLLNDYDAIDEMMLNIYEDLLENKRRNDEN